MTSENLTKPHIRKLDGVPLGPISGTIRGQTEWFRPDSVSRKHLETGVKTPKSSVRLLIWVKRGRNGGKRAL